MLGKERINNIWSEEMKPRVIRRGGDRHYKSWGNQEGMEIMDIVSMVA